jgi:hypothetical protein
MGSNVSKANANLIRIISPPNVSDIHNDNPGGKRGKANLAPVREFLRRVFSNMGRIREDRNEFAANCESGLAFAP